MTKDIPTQESTDLVLTRIVDVPRELIWKAWTTPEYMKEWFVPKPWTTKEVEIDLRPGGIFRTVMSSPEGEEFPNTGCFLEVVENEKLVWTDALLPNYRPSAEPFFTAHLHFEDYEGGTRYTAIAMHGNEENRQKHADMGFHDGWGTVLTQLVDYIKAGHVK